jgi:hypothetical protein
LLITIAFFLAKPVSLHSLAEKDWVVVIPGADITMTKDLPSKDSNEWHWLTPGFPRFENKMNAANIPVSSLLRELDAHLAADTKLTILAPQQLVGLDGERVRLSRKVDWRIVSGKMPLVVTPSITGPMRLNIRFDSASENGARYFRAAHSAWHTNPPGEGKASLDIADISVPLKQNDATLIWLAKGELPSDIRDWIFHGGIAFVSNETNVPELRSSVVAWRNEQGRILLRLAHLGQGRVLQWQLALQPDAMPELLDADFPEHLHALLSPTPAAPAQDLAKYQKPFAGLSAWPESPRPLQNWLSLLIATLFLLERWLANAPRRWTST